VLRCLSEAVLAFRVALYFPKRFVMKIELADRSVVVIGAARGIGRAIADGFVSEGCRVVGFDRAAPENVEQGTAEGNGTSSPFPLVVGDVTDANQVVAFAESVGPVDHVVYCVGIGSGGFGFPSWNVDASSWPSVLDVNLIGAARVANALAPGMVERRHGSFLFLTSVAGQIGSQTDPPYSASKAALINYMQCLAKDLAPAGVRANALSPGMVKTELNRSVWAWGQARLPAEERVEYEAWAEAKIRTVSPLGRWQEPAEFASMAIYLASDHARNITGQTINIDGGWVMHS